MDDIGSVSCSQKLFNVSYEATKSMDFALMGFKSTLAFKGNHTDDVF